MEKRVRQARTCIRRRLALAVASAAVTVVVVDIILRLVAYPYYRPHERYIERWPPMQLLERYLPNRDLTWRVYGDLAAMSGQAELRTYRDTRFVTDPWGFLNAREAYEGDGKLDVILLGDSFAAGQGVSWEQGVAALLDRQSGLKTYSLAIPGNGPWQSMANYLVERERLSEMSHDGTVCLLLFFPGNDLQ